MYHAIVFLPLVGFLIAGLFGRLLGPRPSEIITTALLFVAAVLSWVSFIQVGFGDWRDPGAGGPMDVGRRPRGRLGVPHRHAHRHDAGGGQHGLGPRAPLFHRLHARGSAPPALLRLSVALHLRHADAGDRRQPRPDVLRLGGRRPRVLPADRLLVPEGLGQRRRHEGLHRQPRRRFRLPARHLHPVRAVRQRGLRPDLPARGRAREASASCSSASSGTP